MKPTFQGEVQFRRYSDTSLQGAQIVFNVSGREDLESFVGKEGKRFMAVLVEIGDDELPVQGKPKGGELCKRAVLLCKSERFQEWLGHREGENRLSEDECKRAIYEICEVESRSQLDNDKMAAERFMGLIWQPWVRFQGGFGA